MTIRYPLAAEEDAAAPQGAPAGGRDGGGGRGNPSPPENCPAQDILGPDWDFGAPPALAWMSDGREILIAAQKQGLIWALNPDTGQVLWKQDFAREIDGGRGETLFGGAVDSERAYFGLISSGHVALDLKTGEEVWWTPATPPAGRISAASLVPSP